ncbi:MAG TPA: glycosyltransferase family 4 protein, partial [Candidatus Acidoferrum sp.]
FIMANEGHRWGGSEPLWSEAAAHLARAGNAVSVSAKDWGEPNPRVEKLREAGCQVFYRTEQGKIPPFITRQIRKIFPAPEYYLNYVQTMGNGVDLVVVSQGDNRDAHHWLRAIRDSGCRYAIVAQSAVPHCWPDDDSAEDLSRCYQRASAAYFVSQANLDLSRRQFGSPLSNGKVVRNPFNVGYNVSLPWPAQSPDELSLAHVGRLDVISKAQDVLLEVLGLPHWRERRVRLSLIGEGPHERGLRRIAEHLKLTSVEFAGQQSDIEKIWRKHHALVLPSRFEGMPLVVVEAMLCGRPCVATDVGGNRDLIRDGVNGFLAKAATVELVDEAMNRAWEARGRLREMGEQAAVDVRKWVSADPAADFARELERVASDGAVGAR